MVSRDVEFPVSGVIWNRLEKNPKKTKTHQRIGNPLGAYIFAFGIRHHIYRFYLITHTYIRSSSGFHSWISFALPFCPFGLNLHPAVFVLQFDFSIRKDMPQMLFHFRLSYFHWLAHQIIMNANVVQSVGLFMNILKMILFTKTVPVFFLRAFHSYNDVHFVITKSDFRNVSFEFKDQKWRIFLGLDYYFGLRLKFCYHGIHCQFLGLLRRLKGIWNISFFFW